MIWGSLSRRALVARSRGAQWVCVSCRRAYSEAAEQPPSLLVKIRNDLKTAMRAKDTSRLNVLKSILAEITNASKTNSPINTDMQLVALLRKKINASQAAQDQAKLAGRQDLVQKEQEQAELFNEYASGVDMMSADDVKQAVIDTITELRASDPGLRAGNVMKALFASGGRLFEKPLDKSIVPGFVKNALTTS